MLFFVVLFVVLFATEWRVLATRSAATSRWPTNAHNARWKDFATTTTNADDFANYADAET